MNLVSGILSSCQFARAYSTTGGATRDQLEEQSLETTGHDKGLQSREVRARIVLEVVVICPVALASMMIIMMTMMLAASLRRRPRILITTMTE